MLYCATIPDVTVTDRDCSCPLAQKLDRCHFQFSRQDLSLGERREEKEGRMGVVPI